MVKLNYLLTLLSLSTLNSFVSANEDKCNELENLLNVESFNCITDGNGNIIKLTLEDSTITQDIIDKISSYDTIKELKFTRFGEISNINMESIKVSELTFHDIGIGRKVKKFHGFSVSADVIKTLKNVDTLSISGYQISQETLDALSTLTNVKTLNLPDGGFDKNLDFSCLKNAKSLTKFYLDHYDADKALIEFSESFCKVTQLKDIEISSEIPAIPKCISKLKNLERLNLQYNNITELPKELGSLSKLKFLDLSGNPITSIPSSFKKLTKLETLYLSYTNLGSFSSYICELNNLTVLKFDHNNITKIPSCIKNLSSLKELYFDGNKLTTISSGLYKLQKLEILDLNSNSITKISSNIKNLKNLKNLNFQKNEITVIPDGIGKLVNLIILNLSFNNITEIPDAIGKLINLEELQLSYNSITNLPEALGQLTKLVNLNLFSNQINATIPESLNNLSELTNIDLDYNVDIRGKTLTNPKLSRCAYNGIFNATKDGLCKSENAVCEDYGDIPKCVN